MKESLILLPEGRELKRRGVPPPMISWGGGGSNISDSNGEGTVIDERVKMYSRDAENTTYALIRYKNKRYCYKIMDYRWVF